MAQEPGKSVGVSLQNICRSHRVVELAAFGDDAPEGPLNLLIAFEPGVTLAFADLMDLQDEFAEALQRRIFLVPKASLGAVLRAQTETLSRVIYPA